MVNKITGLLMMPYTGMHICTESIVRNQYFSKLYWEMGLHENGVKFHNSFITITPSIYIKN